MPSFFPSLKERVVVITGASSGIGRAAALAFARKGASVVLAARRLEALQQVAEDCRSIGGKALVVQTDVTNSTEVARLARLAYEQFGDIDVWINNAGAGLLGSYTSADIATQRRVVEINLIGTMNGAAAVMPYFMRQRRGVMITNISVGGLVPVPYAAAYTASKFGMRGFMASLRQELADFPHVKLCSLFPACIDTPGYQHGANVSGAALRPVRPIYSADEVAAAMVSLALSPRRESVVGWTAQAAKTAYALCPQTTESAMGVAMRRYLRRGKPAPRTAGNLYEPVTQGIGSSGGWAGPRSGKFAHGALAGLVVAALGLLVFQSSRRAALAA